MIDLHSFLLLLGVPEGKVGGALAAVSLVFLLLRFITNTPMFVQLQQGDVVVPVPAVMVEEVKGVAAETRAAVARGEPIRIV